MKKSKVEWLAEQYGKLDKDERRDFVNLQAGIVFKDKEKPEVFKPRFELMSSYTEKAKEHYANFGKMVGLSTGFKKLDELTHGMAAGELVVIAGKTSEGKTTLAINIANHVALAGTAVLFVTLEMTKEEITSRYMYINGGDTPNYHTVAAKTVVQEDDELNWKSIDDLIGVAKNEMNVGLVVIDHLHYLTRETENAAEDIGRITKEFKKNAIRHNIPTILISHVRKTTDFMASMEDLRGSSYIAQDADIVLMVGREQGIANKMLVKIEKNRNRGFDRDRPMVELYTDKIRLTDEEQEPIYQMTEIFKEDEIVRQNADIVATVNSLWPSEKEDVI